MQPQLHQVIWLGLRAGDCGWFGHVEQKTYPHPNSVARADTYRIANPHANSLACAIFTATRNRTRNG